MDACRRIWRRLLSGVTVSPIVMSPRFATTLPRANPVGRDKQSEPYVKTHPMPVAKHT